MNTTALPPVRLRTLGLSHRILRAMAETARSLKAIEITVNEDGHDICRPSNINTTVFKLVLEDLVMHSGTDDKRLYDLTDAGEALLKSLEAKVAAAITQRQSNDFVREYRSKAEPDVMPPPIVNLADIRLLTCSPLRRAASAADLAPAAPRPGSGAAMDCPSRMNNRLYYRDGRVTDLQGNRIKP